MELEIIIIVLLTIILFIVLSGHIYVVHKNSIQPVIDNTEEPVNIGGCAGTRYGCCPNTQIPKLNMIGSNCRY